MPAKSDKRLEISFASLKEKRKSTAAIVVAEGGELVGVGAELDEASDGALSRAIEAADFKGKSKSSLEVLGAAGLAEKRVVLCGMGDPSKASENDIVLLGGAVCGKLAARDGRAANLVVDVDDEGAMPGHEIAAALALGAYLRSYTFEKYITKKSDNDDEPEKDKLATLVVHCADAKKAEKAFARHKAVGDGVMLARDLVNEPANTLGPVEFADKAKALEELGIEVEILEPKELKKLKMGSLLAVAQGSSRPARVAVMHWKGGKKSDAPVAFVGKGVVFDTGGISIKPSGGMEDMKGDMGGAACVTGLMHALAARKAKVNAVGIIGCVENMPSGDATRPGDIVTSMSGQTIEVLNTDAEGRLVLADIMWYVQEQYKPQMMVDLATLTGAIMIALGKSFAGLFCNNDELAAAMAEASEATGEKTWRMPLDKSYHKLIDSKNADVKNIGGRWGGACTAAAFLERFVKDKDLPWAHLDVAGTAMDGSRNDINQSWGSGWGVRLLDRLVADKYEN